MRFELLGCEIFGCIFFYSGLHNGRWRRPLSCIWGHLAWCGPCRPSAGKCLVLLIAQLIVGERPRPWESVCDNQRISAQIILHMAFSLGRINQRSRIEACPSVPLDFVRRMCGTRVERRPCELGLVAWVRRSGSGWTRDERGRQTGREGEKLRRGGGGGKGLRTGARQRKRGSE